MAALLKALKEFPSCSSYTDFFLKTSTPDGVEAATPPGAGAETAASAGSEQQGGAATVVPAPASEGNQAEQAGWVNEIGIDARPDFP